MRQRDQVAAGYDVNLGGEPLPGHPPLEVQREEPVLAAGSTRVGTSGQRSMAHGWPNAMSASGIVVRLPRRRDVRGHVMQEIGGQLEFRRITARLGRRHAGLLPSPYCPTTPPEFRLAAGSSG